MKNSNRVESQVSFDPVLYESEWKLMTQWWRSFLARATKALVNVRKSGCYDEENTAHLGNACWKENIRHGFAQEIFLPNAGWRHSATNFALETAATQNQSYIVDGNWKLLTTECVNSLGQKFSRFIGELQRHSLRHSLLYSSHPLPKTPSNIVLRRRCAPHSVRVPI